MADETIPQMRERIDKQNTEISDLRSQLRTFEAREAFRDAGLKPEFGDLFAAQADDKTAINTETASAFAEQYGLGASIVQEEAEVEEAPQTEEESGAPAGSELASMSSGGTSAGDGGAATGGPTMTRQEWIALQQTDPAAAQSALMRGQVQLREDNFYVQRGLVPNR